MQQIDTYDFTGKRALIRVDFNVPQDKETLVITDDTRMRKALPTIQKVLSGGGSVVLMSHLGRPKQGPEERFSLKPVATHLSTLLGKDVKFVDDCVSAEAFEVTGALQPGEVVLLENLRFYKHETAGDEGFSERLSKHGDVYVNDAFGTAHRAHASTTVVAKFFADKMFGYLIEKEIESVDKVLHATGKRTAIVGGAKVSSKIEILTNLLDKVDNIIIGGGMAYTFVKAQGGSTGSSLVENDYLDTAKSIMEDAKAKGVNIYLPEDSVVADKFANDAQSKVVESVQIPDGWMGLDIGEKAAQAYDKVISESDQILWNGPMGVFEMENFQQGTKAVAESVVRATEKGTFSLVGGGDSVAAVNKFGYADQVSHVSTGGGAMLEYLEGKALPGIAAIKD